MKTNELTGAALNWAVAKCEGLINGDALDVGFICEGGYTPSTNWAQGGAIIEREMIEIIPQSAALWDAMKRDQHIPNDGPTPLIAAMRCHVASKLGDDAELPQELRNESITK